MNLPFLKSIQPQKQEKHEYFFALLFKPFKFGVILFEERNGGLHIVTSSEKALDTDIENISAEELLSAADHAISTVESSLPEGVEVNKTIFSLPYNYIAEGKIKKDYLFKFKKLCEDLGLSPMGFIVTIEAIVYFLQKKEGIPITSIFVEVTKEIVYVYMVRAGNIVEVKFSDRSDNIAATIEKILRYIESFEVLPTKMILLAYEGIEEIQQELLSHTWSSTIAFLHDPQVVALEKGFEDEAIINGVASQMGFDVTTEEVKQKNDIDVNEEQKDIEEENNDFGFVKEEVEDKEEIEDEKAEEEHYEESESEEDENHSTRIEKRRRISVPVSMNTFVASILAFKKRLSFPNPLRGGKNGLLLRVGILVVILCVLLFGVSYVYYSTVVRTEVVLFVSKKSFDETVPITFVEDKETNVEDKIVKISFVEVEENGNASKNTTGKKETGEKAKGEVIIYNKTESSKTFGKGSVVVGPNNLEFELISDVTVASTAAFSTNFSNVKSSIVALKFGSEYNLPSNTNFSFKEFPTSSYFAKNESALTGGTKKNLDVVAKNDIDELAADLIDNLEDNALNGIKAKVADDEVTLPFIISSEFVSRTYNKKEGEEAQQLTLAAKVKFTGASYKRSDIEKYEQELIRNKIPEGYSRLLSESKNEVADEKIEKNKISANLILKSTYVPSIDEGKIKQSLIGKSEAEAEQLLKDVKNINGYKLFYSNNVPLFPVRLPMNGDHIKITIRFE